MCPLYLGRLTRAVVAHMAFVSFMIRQVVTTRRCEDDGLIVKPRLSLALSRSSKMCTYGWSI